MENYIKGIFFNKASDKAPEFVKGNITIKRQTLIEELSKMTEDTIKLDCLISREDKGYLKINTWKKDDMAESLGGKVVENIPF